MSLGFCETWLLLPHQLARGQTTPSALFLRTLLLSSLSSLGLVRGANTTCSLFQGAWSLKPKRSPEELPSSMDESGPWQRRLLVHRRAPGSWALVLVATRPCPGETGGTADGPTAGRPTRSSLGKWPDGGWAGRPRKMGTAPCQGDPAGLSRLALHILGLRVGAHSGSLDLRV